MTRIEQLLRDRIGLDATSIGSSVIQHSFRARMKGLGFKRVGDYLDLVESSAAEWNELVESVIVAETWFFRDAGSFSALANMVMQEWLPRHPEGPLRLLSLPCSTGEEPYSAAMALFDAGVPEHRLQIDGVDISARALDRARRAVYGKNSFRGRDLAFRDRHFQRSENEYALQPALLDCVRFRQANLMEPDLTFAEGFFDFIFFRNLVIYFDGDTRRMAFEKVRRWLAPAGVLFVGPAEIPLAVEHGFVSAKIPQGFACVKSDARLTPRPRRAAQPVTPAALPASAFVPPLRNRSSLPQTPSAAEAAPEKPRASLEEVLRLADAGRLQEAAELCLAHLQANEPSAQAYYLLGLVRDAEGDSRAEEYYRKALYLEPDHYETLVQLALLSHKNGQPDRARVLKSRAQRMKTGT
jgi:chemotaxis protein methyltransferase WspC